MTPSHQAAHNEIQARASGMERGDEANAWRHAALVVSQFTDTPRALKQLHQHASFVSSEVKKSVYRKAAAILTERTGIPFTEKLPAVVTRQDIAFTALGPVLPGFALAAVA